MPAQQDYVDQMIRALAISEPTLDTSIGTPIRHIVEAVADVAGSAAVDKYLLDYTYDIDSKTGDDLENFVRLFGFSRLPAKRAAGTVTFTRSTASATTVTITKGTQVGTNDNPSILFNTVVPAVIGVGETSVEVPVQAVVPGTAGNVAANTVQATSQPLGGIASFTNLVAMTGGTDAENDQQIRQRFKSTIFRNLAGTEHMFLGIALENANVSQANVVGASKRRREQVQVIAGTARTTVPDAKYTFVGRQTFGPNIDGGQVLTPNVHYTFDASQNPPVITIIDRVAAPDNLIYDIEYEYTPTSSRNDPVNGVMNRVDVYVAGMNATEATESRVFSLTTVFDNTVGSLYNASNYRRLSGAQPTVGNYFIPLAFSPVTDPSLSNQIVIGPITYQENVDYFLVNDISPRGGAPQSLSGIEWVSLANGATKTIPTVGAAFVADYTYNAVPREVEVAIREWRLVTQDVWVHQAQTMLLNVYLSVILEQGITAAAVLPNIISALRNLTTSVGFNGVLQTSDVIFTAHAVPGVDAVRFTKNTDDPAHYAMQQVAPDGTTVLQTFAGSDGRAIDVFSSDNTVIVINNVILAVKAQNTF